MPTHEEQDKYATKEREDLVPSSNLCDEAGRQAYAEEYKCAKREMREHRWSNLTDNKVVHLDHSSQWPPVWTIPEGLTQLDDAAIERPFPRRLNGHISATKIQQHGPQLYPKAVGRVSVVLCHRAPTLPIAKIHTKAHAAQPAPKAHG